MTQLTRFFVGFSLVLFSFTGEAFGDEIENAKEAVSRAENKYYEALRAGGKNADPAALRNSIVAPAAQDLAKTLHKKHEAVVRKNMRLDQQSKLPDMPDMSEFNEEAESDEGNEMVSAGDEAVVQKILGETDGESAQPRKTAAAAAPPAPGGVVARPVVRAQGKVARPAPPKPEASADDEDNSLKAPPKEGEGVNVMEF